MIRTLMGRPPVKKQLRPMQDPDRSSLHLNRKSLSFPLLFARPAPCGVGGGDRGDVSP
ncbi:hypothetical protein [Brevundimonas basaltis]|uniref:Uncharacterized protein n=1 Tax=Brevundimonas basaltis TaxID=472166 RepID=A0A7W8HYW8_9CAUL|nr:hypothetical protein [Brevundimonas basaltis]